eukprot:TRINITY_DN15283_c2_g1_i1.p1 TRINITY_DN15283_c2_g1~~TRINITY_DN15283_c2_g1_i1.p1  ORF type:complete len:762 (-),score=159.92 TRINITY_DN15283_c2_g1_i1:148-2433(-)
MTEAPARVPLRSSAGEIVNWDTFRQCMRRLATAHCREYEKLTFDFLQEMSMNLDTMTSSSSPLERRRFSSMDFKEVPLDMSVNLAETKQSLAAPATSTSPRNFSSSTTQMWAADPAAHTVAVAQTLPQTLPPAPLRPAQFQAQDGIVAGRSSVRDEDVSVVAASKNLARDKDQRATGSLEGSSRDSFTSTSEKGGASKESKVASNNREQPPASSASQTPPPTNATSEGPTVAAKEQNALVLINEAELGVCSLSVAVGGPAGLGQESQDADSVSPSMTNAMRQFHLDSLEQFEKGFVQAKKLHLTAASTSALASISRTLPIFRVIEWFMQAEEPVRTGLLANIEQSRKFELISAVVILCNIVIICISTNLDMQRTASLQIGEVQPAGGEDWEGTMEILFFVFYMGELLIRLAVHRIHFFLNTDWGWNTLDFSLVMLSVVEVGVGAAGGASVNLMFLRILRLLKLSKLLRLVRAIRFLRELRLFVECLRGCFVQLFWAVVMMTIVLLIFSLFFVQALSGYLRTDDTDLSAKTEILEFFGSVQGTMLVLFKVVSGGTDWGEPYAVVASTGPMASSVFLFFVMFFTVAVWNIVASVFLENTMKVAMPEREEELLDKHIQDLGDARELMRICKEADTDFSGSVSVDEFSIFMENEKFREFLELRGIDIKDTGLFFHMITSATGCTDVDLEMFVGTCLRVRGPATSIDLHTIGFEAKTFHAITKAFFSFCEDRFHHMDQQLYSMHGALHALSSQASGAQGATNLHSM